MGGPALVVIDFLVVPFQKARMRFQFPVLAPKNCDCCGLCCEGIGSPVAIYTYRASYSGPYLFRPRDLPPELGREIDDYFGGLRGGQPPVEHCLWFDAQTRQCKHHEWRPAVCRKYEVGCASCLDERRPYVALAGEDLGPSPDSTRESRE